MKGLNMLKKYFLFLVFVLLFTSCSSTPENRLKISATTWIGYTPLFYAKEKGWLKEFNIKLLNVSSLSENMYLYEAGNSDAYVGTQYEYGILSKKDTTLKPIIMFDRSNGGDIIMSNMDINELQISEKKIDAYLEIDSINNTLLKSFIKKHSLNIESINYINKDQAQIAHLKTTKNMHPTIIITYAPYNLALEKNGFVEVASTKDDLDLIVVDAMFTTSKVFGLHQRQFKELKKMIDKSVVSLHKDPKEFYNTIKPYMLEMTFDEFQNTLGDIVWINKGLSPELQRNLNHDYFPTRDLI